MVTRLRYLVLAFGTVGLSALAHAQGTGTGVLKLPQDIEFKGPLTGPPQTVVLYGDPTKPGVFVSRVNSRPAGRTHRIGILMRCVPLWCYLGRSTSAVATNGMRASSRRIRRAHSTLSLQGLPTSHRQRTVR